MRSTVMTAGVLLALAGAAAAQDMKALLKGSKETKSAAKDLPAAAKDSLAKALPGAFDPAKDGKPTVWTSKDLPNPADDTEVFETAWTVVVSPVAVTAVRDPETKELLIAAVQAAGKLPDGLPEGFLDGFRNKALTSCSLRPTSDLEALRKQAAAGADDAAKQLQTLFLLNEHMLQVEVAEDAWEEGAAKPEAKAHAKKMAEAYEKARTYLDQASGFVFKAASPSDPAKAERQQAALAKAAEKASGEVKSFAEAAESGDAAAARKRLKGVSCGSCHANYRKAFRQVRLDRGIGDGYFLPGHDLLPVAEAERPAAEGVAGAVRKALLLIDAATK